MTLIFFRLVCESTVEENILKKANQKRMLGNIAIESGAFTTEFFKKVCVHVHIHVHVHVCSKAGMNIQYSIRRFKASKAF